LGAGCARLERHRDVPEDDWRLAEHVMRVSDVTREGLKAELRRQDEAKARSAGLLDAERELVRQEHAENTLRARVQQKVLNLLAEGKQPAARHFTPPQRRVLDEVLASMTEQGLIRGTDEGLVVAVAS